MHRNYNTWYANLKLSLFRQEYALVALALVKLLWATSFNTPTVVCHHSLVPSPLIPSGPEDSGPDGSALLVLH